MSQNQKQEKLINEYLSIISKMERKMSKSKTYATTEDFQNNLKRMTSIMREVEGCGCGPRGEALAKTFKWIAEGNFSAAKSLGSTVFKDYGMLFNRLLGR